MPQISRFYGIIIAMYHNDHAPPHFHVHYAGKEAAFRVATMEILEGSIPPRARALVVEWATLHRKELQANWDLARNKQPLRKVDPLP